MLIVGGNYNNSGSNNPASNCNNNNPNNSNSNNRLPFHTLIQYPDSIFYGIYSEIVLVLKRFIPSEIVVLNGSATKIGKNESIKFILVGFKLY